MRYLSKNYYDFIQPKLSVDITEVPQQEQILLNEDKVNKRVWIGEKVECLRKKIAQLKKELSAEYNPNLRKKLQMEIRVCELKIMIAQIK